MFRLFLIDSSALAFRMFYAYARNPLRNSKGQLLKSHKPDYFAIVRDGNPRPHAAGNVGANAIPERIP